MPAAVAVTAAAAGGACGGAGGRGGAARAGSGAGAGGGGGGGTGGGGGGGRGSSLGAGAGAGGAGLGSPAVREPLRPVAICSVAAWRAAMRAALAAACSWRYCSTARRCSSSGSRSISQGLTCREERGRGGGGGSLHHRTSMGRPTLRRRKSTATYLADGPMEASLVRSPQPLSLRLSRQHNVATTTGRHHGSIDPCGTNSKICKKQVCASNALRFAHHYPHFSPQRGKQSPGQHGQDSNTIRVLRTHRRNANAMLQGSQLFGCL